MSICNNLDTSPENDDEWKEPTWKGYIVYDSIYTIFLKKIEMDSRLEVPRVVKDCKAELEDIMVLIKNWLHFLYLTADSF